MPLDNCFYTKMLNVRMLDYLLFYEAFVNEKYLEIVPFTNVAFSGLICCCMSCTRQVW